MSNDTKSGQFGLENYSWKIGIICESWQMFVGDSLIFYELWDWHCLGPKNCTYKINAIYTFLLVIYSWKVIKTTKFSTFFVCNFFGPNCADTPNSCATQYKMLRKPGFFLSHRRLCSLLRMLILFANNRKVSSPQGHRISE